MNAWQRWLGWAMPATPQERAAALWSFAYFFALLAGYYVLRPLRDQMGIAGGVRNLPWLFTATFVTLIVAQPLYGALVAKLPRARFVPIVYHFFVANLAVFWLLLTLGVAPVIVARVFFVWVSVFSLFAVAVFWSFMADLFTAEQGKRLFGFIGAGGTAGGLLGPLITIGLSVPLGAVNLLIAAAVLLTVLLGGWGIAALPVFLGMQWPGLARFATDEAGSSGFWIVVHPDLQHTGRVRAVIEHLIAVMGPVQASG